MAERLSSAAAAALGITRAQTTRQPERLSWVDIEDAPRMVVIHDPDTQEPLGQFAKFEDDDEQSMSNEMLNKAREVCDVVDDAQCEANTCIESRYAKPDGTPVGATIGWALAGDADERTEFEPFAVVAHGRRVLAVCAACSPTGIYDLLWGPTE